MTLHTDHCAPTSRVPNHHAGHPGFSGLTGLFAGLTMLVGRGGDARLALDLTGVSGHDHLVDIGSGPGTAARAAAGMGATVTGVEPARVMRRLARLAGVGRSGRLSYVEGVAEALPLADAAATVAWSLATVHHWPDVDSGLAEVVRVLIPGGRFLAIERRTTPGATGLASHGWTDDQAEAFAARCAAAGLVAVEVAHHDLRRRRLVTVRAVRP